MLPQAQVLLKVKLEAEQQAQDETKVLQEVNQPLQIQANKYQIRLLVRSSVNCLSENQMKNMIKSIEKKRRQAKEASLTGSLSARGTYYARSGTREPSPPPQ
jgi:primosomal protein N'